MKRFTAITSCCSKLQALSLPKQRVIHLLAGSFIRLSVVSVILLVNVCLIAAKAIPNPFPANEISILPSLPNGLRIIVKEDHSQPIVAMEIVIRSGSAEDEGASGVAHLLEHICFQGSANYPEPLSAQYALEMAGISSNAFTDRDMTRYQAQGLSNKAELMLNVLADVVLRPTLTDENCSKEKALIEEEIAHLYDNPVAQLIDSAFAASYPSFPYKIPPLGISEGLGKINGEMLRQFHQRWYVPGNISVVMVGDITKERAAELVSKAFGNFKAKINPALPKYYESEAGQPVSLHIERNLPDTWQMMAFSLPASRDISSMASLQIIKTLLTYGPYALSAHWVREGIDAKKYGVELLPSRFPGRLLIWAETPPEMANRLRLSTMKILNQLAVTPIEPSTVENLKSRLLSDYFLENETFTQQTETLAEYEGLDQLNKASSLFPAISDLTPAKICKALPVRCLAWVTLGQPPKGTN